MRRKIFLGTNGEVFPAVKPKPITFARLSMLAMTLCMLSGCMVRVEQNDKELYDRINLGMSRASVEKILGSPVVERDGDVFYGTRMRSATEPASIRIVYSARKTVQSKVFYGGY